MSPKVHQPLIHYQYFSRAAADGFPVSPCCNVGESSGGPLVSSSTFLRAHRFSDTPAPASETSTRCGPEKRVDGQLTTQPVVNGLSRTLLARYSAKSSEPDE